jgi:hypothetical protein
MMGPVVESLPDDVELGANLAGAYGVRALRGGYLSNLFWDWALGDYDIDDLTVSSADLASNPEIRRVVDKVMREYAKWLCKQGASVSQQDPLSHSEQFEFKELPLSGILHLGTLSAEGSGDVSVVEYCDSCEYVYILANWKYEDEIDMLSWKQLYQGGYFDIHRNPLKTLLAPGAIAEGWADLLLDEIIDANYLFVVDWEEALEGCCEEFVD